MINRPCGSQILGGPAIGTTKEVRESRHWSVKFFRLLNWNRGHTPLGLDSLGPGLRREMPSQEVDQGSYPGWPRAAWRRDDMNGRRPDRPLLQYLLQPAVLQFLGDIGFRQRGYAEALDQVCLGME
jgi:hypothetical protein